MSATLLSTNKELSTTDELEIIELLTTEMCMIGGGEPVVVFE